MIGADFWDGGGRIHPHYRPLSDAASRADAERTEWERRAVASARWFARATQTFWPSEALISCMTALECLFVRDRGVRDKGAAIANRSTERWVTRGRTVEDEREWLRTLYRARNDAVHEGRKFVEDLEVDRLVDLTAYAVRWGAWHLYPYHAHSQRACATFDEVMAHDLSDEDD